MEKAMQLLDGVVVEAGVKARLTSGSAWLAWTRGLRDTCMEEAEFDATIHAAMSIARDRENQWALGAPDIQ